MNLPYFIAKRYLLSKKTHNAINLVSLVSVFGVMVAVAALIVTLSVYNGFQDLLKNLYGDFDPQVKIKAVEGKTFVPNTEAFQAIKADEDVAVYCETLEDNALIIYKDAQTSAVIKGVEESFSRLTHIDSLMYAGTFKLKEYDFIYATLGVGLASVLGTGSSFIDPVTIYVPRRTGTINLANPAASFTSYPILLCGTFGINQPEYDDNYAIVPLSIARDLFEYTNEVTAIELKLKDGANFQKTINRFKKTLGPAFTVQSLMEQKAELYRVNRIEKWMTYLMLSFILLIALFNVVGSLSMLILEKRKDAVTLNELGADTSFIRKTFMLEGRLISLTGAVLGVLIGAGVCYVQQHFGLLKLGGGGNYIVEAYPVQLELLDVLIVLITTILISIPATWWPVHLYFNRKSDWVHETLSRN